MKKHLEQRIRVPYAVLIQCRIPVITPTIRRDYDVPWSLNYVEIINHPTEREWIFSNYPIRRVSNGTTTTGSKD